MLAPEEAPRRGRGSTSRCRRCRARRASAPVRNVDCTRAGDGGQRSGRAAPGSRRAPSCDSRGMCSSARGVSPTASITTSVIRYLRSERDQAVARPFQFAGQTGDETFVVARRVAHDAPGVGLHLVVAGQRHGAAGQRGQRTASREGVSSGSQQFPVHQRVGLRRPSRQGLRPDFGRGAGCVPRERHQARHRGRQPGEHAARLRDADAPPTRSSSPAKAAARRRCSRNTAIKPWSTAR